MGALLGLAVGDALGTTYEFQRLEQPPYPRLAVGPAIDVVGRGPFGLQAGVITDDTQMAVCLARSLVECRGLDVEDVARRYVEWAQHAFDVGNQTADALQRIRGGSEPHIAGLATWRDSGRRAAGNGSLMRCAPLAVKYAHYATPPRDPSALAEHAIAESMITHADPRCTIACAMFQVAIASAIDDTKGRDRRPETRRAAAAAAGKFAASWLRDLWGNRREPEEAPSGAVVVRRPTADGFTDIAPVSRKSEGDGPTEVSAVDADLAEVDADLAAIDDAERDLLADLDAAAGATPRVYGEDGRLDLYQTAGFVRVALRLAFWHDQHTASWRDAVVDVASRGGDADTNAAIVGALLGARDGASEIPPEWKERVLRATLPGPADWAEAHHPRHLLALV